MPTPMPIIAATIGVKFGTGTKLASSPTMASPMPMPTIAIMTGRPLAMTDRKAMSRPEAAVGLEDDTHRVARLLRKAGLQQVVGGDGVRAGQLGAVGIAAVERLAQEPEGQKRDDPQDEDETAAVVAPASASFEHRKASF